MRILAGIRHTNGTFLPGNSAATSLRLMLLPGAARCGTGGPLPWAIRRLALLGPADGPWGTRQPRWNAWPAADRPVVVFSQGGHRERSSESPGQVRRPRVSDHRTRAPVLVTPLLRRTPRPAAVSACELAWAACDASQPRVAGARSANSRLRLGDARNDHRAIGRRASCADALTHQAGDNNRRSRLTPWPGAPQTVKEPALAALWKDRCQGGGMRPLRREVRMSRSASDQVAYVRSLAGRGAATARQQCKARGRRGADSPQAERVERAPRRNGQRRERMER